MTTRSDSAPRLMVIGLVGGIGAGKSAVAACLAKLGCVVIDSDARAKAKLDQPLVREALLAWWGQAILDFQGSVDRSKVAQIVFHDDAQRRRLEGLVHPLLASDRADTIAKAARDGASGVVIDAPLLLEAGLEARCDAVIFVEASRQIRLLRVAQSRGWDEAELDRREKAQMGLAKKRRIAHDVIVNAGSADDLCREVRRVFHEIQRKTSQRSLES